MQSGTERLFAFGMVISAFLIVAGGWMYVLPCLIVWFSWKRYRSL